MINEAPHDITKMIDPLRASVALLAYDLDMTNFQSSNWGEDSSESLVGILVLKSLDEFCFLTESLAEFWLFLLLITSKVVLDI